MRQSFGFVSNNPLMKNITDYLVDEGSYEEDILLGNTYILQSLFIKTADKMQLEYSCSNMQIVKTINMTSK